MRMRSAVTRMIMPLLLAGILLIAGCGQSTNPPSNNPFTTTWSLGEEGRSISISGDAIGHKAGESSEFTLRFDNSGQRLWMDEYCVLLVGTEGIVKEITHGSFEAPVGMETPQTITVDFPTDLKGPVGLSVSIPGRGGSITTIWVGEKETVNAGPWASVGSCSYYKTEEGSRKLAESFVRNSPTFMFDGIEDTLEWVETLYPDSGNTWQFVVRFESAHAGYGDRTGQMLAAVIMPHEAVITVEQGGITSAVMDGKWDMLRQQMIDDIEISLAPIHEVEVYFMESFPVQVGARIKGGLRDGCTTFREALVSREGDVANIEVTVEKPKGIDCPAVYSYFEEYLNLGSDFATGAEYTLKVNDFTTTFTMP